MEIFGYGLLILVGLSSGVVVAGAVFAFITIIGLVPRLAQKTRTQGHIKIYETAIIAGGIFGTMAGIFNMHIPIGSILAALIGLCVGVFYGVLAMSLAETLDVIPILTRRIRIQQGMFFFIMAIAFGKMTGALLYALIPGFYNPGG